MKTLYAASLAVALAGAAAAAVDEPHRLMTWVKRHPREDGQGKPSPRMGYETSYGYDPSRRLLVRYGGHNQGGGGEQNSEVWTYDLDGDVWTLKEPNDAPPGVCCAQQNVYDDVRRRFIRFPAFSGSHGWQSFREIYLKNSSVWTYDLDQNAWGAMRPFPEVWPAPLRGAAYDPHHGVTVLHGGEGARYGTSVYDLHTNTWHELSPDPAPPNVSQPGFAYDAVNRVFVLFGSQFESDPRTWVYDLRENRWQVFEVDRHPPADKSCPVLAADTRNGIVLCSVRGEDGLETWALDVAKRAWTQLDVDRQPDPSGARNRVLLYLPDGNLFVLENRANKEQQVWTFRYADAPRPPPAPRPLVVRTEPGKVKLAWESAVGEPRYEVYRGRGEKPWEVDFRRIAKDVTDTPFEDPNVEPGVVYHYQICLAGAAGGGRNASFVGRTQPPVVVDLCASVIDAGRVELEWVPPSSEAVGYHVERAEISVYSTDEVLRIKQRYRHTSDLAVGRIRATGPFQRLTDTPLASPRFVDTSVDLAGGQSVPAKGSSGDKPLPDDQLDPKGKPYRYAVCAYRVIAVNRLGVRSGPSPLVFTYPSAVENVFAKEEGAGQTRLRWQRNPEKGIQGYLVYRHDGRWNTDPIVRVTPEPADVTETLDAAAGESTRRYEVVAVDALGQEGEPSRPVWSRREWGRFYVPYTSQWHQ
ncbi:MAG: hypothetical protein ACYTG0_15010 [Planctomycetota bacterium]|jgi:hypothetical protein